jgi:hypothetical protein
VETLLINLKAMKSCESSAFCLYVGQRDASASQHAHHERVQRSLHRQKQQHGAIIKPHILVGVKKDAIWGRRCAKRRNGLASC